jgi:orotate phosphoribosyltransferase
MVIKDTIENNERISELLVDTGAYKDLDQPVILTSGALGIYYVNTEKLVQDGGKFEEYGDSSQAMIKHAVSMMAAHPTFKETIDILAEKILSLNAETIDIGLPIGISGGQRRDWLFSGPVANRLGLPHLSLYKQEEGKKDKMEIVMPDGSVSSVSSLKGTYFIHVVDLITEGSSVYKQQKDGQEKGWVPMIRAKNSIINDLVAVVSRHQGGEEALAEQNVNVHSFVTIDENFLDQYSNNPQRALSYQENPEKWTEDYLNRNGALVLLKTFNPDGGKLDRARKFLDRYEPVLKEAGKFDELDLAVQNEYGKTLSEYRR